MIPKFIRRLFAGIVRGDAPLQRTPGQRPAGLQEDVEAHLDRMGLRIERRNPHIPTMAANQFMGDVAATKHGGAGNPRRIESNTDTLR
jgi:hypothetical protein